MAIYWAVDSGYDWYRPTIEIWLVWLDLILIEHLGVPSCNLYAVVLVWWFDIIEWVLDQIIFVRFVEIGPALLWADVFLIAIELHRLQFLPINILLWLRVIPLLVGADGQPDEDEVENWGVHQDYHAPSWFCVGVRVGHLVYYTIDEGPREPAQ